MKTFFIFLSFIVVSNLSFAQITFDADFESGNINTVTTTDSINYTVTTKSDIGGRWFYFRMIGVKDKFISVKVTSSDVKRAVYSYDNINYERYTTPESPQTNVFQKTYAKDTVYVSYYIPYTFTYLQSRIGEWVFSPYVKLDTLGHTLRNLPIQELTLTDFSVPDSGKLHVWIHSRTHPGETPTSFHFDGVMETLLSDNPVIQYYREQMVFHLIPFTNPDGVFYGRSRTNYDGIDVESNWDKPLAETCKEVQILKARMSEINSENVLVVFQNLHSQAAPYCTFWIHTAASTSDYFYRRQLQFCNLNTSENPHFVKSDYRFSSLQSKFPEGWLWNGWGDQVLALTYETPYDWYSNNQLVTIDNLKYLGNKLVYAIAEFLEFSHPKRILLDNNTIASFWQHDTSGVEFFGKDYQFTFQGNNLGPILYETDIIEAGKYDVYGWWQSAIDNAFDTKITISGGGEGLTQTKSQKLNGGQWNYLGTINQFSPGKISISVSDSGTGRIVADAFRVVYDGVPSRIKEATIPKDFTLYQNYPNPFNPETTIQFELNKSMIVKLKVYNVIGELVAILVNQELNAGTHKFVVDSSITSRLASGIYYYNLTAGNYSDTKGMVLIK
jgi:hypothetical protein